MALVYQATCPKCGQVHLKTGMRSVYAPPAVEVCGECVLREAKQAVEDAECEARSAALRLYNYTLNASAAVDEAKLDVLFDLATEGANDLATLRRQEAFWKRVQKAIES